MSIAATAGQHGHGTPLGQCLVRRRAGGRDGQRVTTRRERLEHVLYVDSVVVRQRRRLAEPDPAARVLQAHQHELAIAREPDAETNGARMRALKH